MAMRQRATQCLGKLPDTPRSRHSNHRSLWPGHQVRLQDEQETSRLILASGSPCASVTPERLFRSRETVKAWLESSPTSVLDDSFADRSTTPSSSFESSNSSPVGSDRHNYSSRFLSASSNNRQSAHARVRAISPPRCPANRNPADVSRIDAGHYSGGSFLMLAFRNAQNRGTPSPPAFQYTSGAFRPDHHQDFATEECSSPRSEFSLTSEWQNMLAAGNAAGMSTRDSSANNSEFENGNGSEFDWRSANSVYGAHRHVVREPCRTRSMELPRTVRTPERLASGMEQYATARHSAPLKKFERGQGLKYDVNDLQRMSSRNSERSTYTGEPFEYVHQQQKMLSTAAAWEEAKYAKLTSRYEREEREMKSWEDEQRAKVTSAMKQAERKLEMKRARLMEKLQKDMSMARRKAEEKKATAEAKRAEKAARLATECKNMRRTGKAPRGCLFLG